MSDVRDPAWEEELAASGDIRARVRDALAEDGPPAALDAAILAAAHRAAGAGPRTVKRGWLTTWRVPLSAAAVLVLATSLSVLLYEEGGHRRALETGALPPAAPEAPAGARPEPTASAAARSAADAGQMQPDAALEPAASEASRPTITPSARVRKMVPPMKEVSKPDAHGEARQEAIPGSPPAAPAGALDQPEVKTLTESAPAAAMTRSEEVPSIAPQSSLPSKRSDVVPAAREGPAAPAAVTRAAPGESERDARVEAARSQSSANNQASAPRRKMMDSARLATQRSPDASALSSGRLHEIEALWRAGQRDEARAGLRQWLCEHPEVPAPPDFPIPFDEDTRCARVPPKDAFPADR